MVANRAAWDSPWKNQKIMQLATLLSSALKAEGVVGLKMNAPAEKVDAIIAVLPSQKAPTVSHLYQSQWVSIESVLPEKAVRQIVPSLIALGAEGIIEYPITKII